MSREHNWHNGDNKGRGGMHSKASCLDCCLEHNIANLSKHRCWGMPVLTQRDHEMAGYYFRKQRLLKNKPRNDAEGNPIEWRLSTADMKQLWDEGGIQSIDQIWSPKCGDGSKLVLSRYNDIGHYELGNCHWQSSTDNIKEGHSHRTHYPVPWNKGLRKCK